MVSEPLQRGNREVDAVGVQLVPGDVVVPDLLHDGEPRVNAILQQHALDGMGRGVGGNIGAVRGVDDADADGVGEVASNGDLGGGGRGRCDR